MQSPLVVKSNHEKMAKYIAENAMLLGLDDNEEVLLWEFFAIHGAETDVEIQDCLYKLSEMNPEIVSEFTAIATVDDRWIKASGLFKKKPKLQVSINLKNDLDSLISYDKDSLIKKQTNQVKTKAFMLWYELLTYSDIDGRVVEVSQDDVNVEIVYRSESLRTKLKEFIRGRDIDQDL